MKDATKNVVLLSKRPGKTEWHIRNDKISKEHDFDMERAMADANKQIMRWQASEPDTQFKIEVRAR